MKKELIERLLNGEFDKWAIKWLRDRNPEISEVEADERISEILDPLLDWIEIYL